MFYLDIGQESYEEGFYRMEQELQEAILDHFLGIKVDFLDTREELEGGPIGTSTEAPSLRLSLLVFLPSPDLLQPTQLLFTPFQLVPYLPSSPPLLNLLARPSSTAVNPSKEVGI